MFGLVGDGFALVAADTSAVGSILVHKSDEDKIMVLDSHKLLGASGEAGDRFVLRSDSYDFVLALIMVKFVAFPCLFICIGLGQFCCF